VKHRIAARKTLNMCLLRILFLHVFAIIGTLRGRVVNCDAICFTRGISVQRNWNNVLIIVIKSRSRGYVKIS